jgi:hypothetical protein
MPPKAHPQGHADPKSFRVPKPRAVKLGMVAPRPAPFQAEQSLIVSCRSPECPQALSVAAIAVCAPVRLKYRAAPVCRHQRLPRVRGRSVWCSSSHNNYAAQQGKRFGVRNSAVNVWKRFPNDRSGCFSNFSYKRRREVTKFENWERANRPAGEAILIDFEMVNIHTSRYVKSAAEETEAT